MDMTATEDSMALYVPSSATAQPSRLRQVAWPDTPDLAVNVMNAISVLDDNDLSALSTRIQFLERELDGHLMVCPTGRWN
ncbi:MAG: hypothetical protein AAAB35_11925 [Phyllobacterium sp.]|uniref:hypothetical protein n=1 Tax=Phyllobacterium sp. TaxID=1871046 RepID=UPI0030F0ADEE